MARPEQQPRSIHPPDPLNSYREPSFRGWLVTGILILATIVALWLAYGAALNNPELQREADGRQEVQGPLFPPADPGPGGL